MLAGINSERPRGVDDLLQPQVIARLNRLDLRSLRMFPGKLQGERRSKRRGQSVEFQDYRTYTPGDDLRFIDWNIYARLDRLFIKLFLEEEDLALHLAIDASVSMDAGRPNKLLWAARLAAALGYIGLVRQNRVGISIFGGPQQQEILRLPDCRGRRNVQRLAQFLLEGIWGNESRPGSGQAAPGAAFNEALTTIARLRVGKGVMLVLSDFLLHDGYAAGLKALAAAGGYDTWCVQILAPGELEPEREAGAGFTGDLRLTDAETGRAAEVTLTPALLKRYKQRLEEYCEGLGAFCLKREMAHMLVRSDAEVGQVIVETLRRRGMVG